MRSVADSVRIWNRGTLVVLLRSGGNTDTALLRLFDSVPIKDLAQPLRRHSGFRCNSLHAMQSGRMREPASGDLVPLNRHEIQAIQFQQCTDFRFRISSKRDRSGISSVFETPRQKVEAG